jgi:hypothetical protein
MKIKTDDQAPVAKCVGDDMGLSSHPKASMQNLLDAVAEFEPGLVLERVQPIHTVAHPAWWGGKPFAKS